MSYVEQGSYSETTSGGGSPSRQNLGSFTDHKSIIKTSDATDIGNLYGSTTGSFSNNLSESSSASNSESGSYSEGAAITPSRSASFSHSIVTATINKESSGHSFSNEIAYGTIKDLVTASKTTTLTESGTYTTYGVTDTRSFSFTLDGTQSRTAFTSELATYTGAMLGTYGSATTKTAFIDTWDEGTTTIDHGNKSINATFNESKTTKDTISFSTTYVYGSLVGGVAGTFFWQKNSSITDGNQSITGNYKILPDGTESDGTSTKSFSESTSFSVSSTQVGAPNLVGNQDLLAAAKRWWVEYLFRNEFANSYANK